MSEMPSLPHGREVAGNWAASIDAFKAETILPLQEKMTSITTELGDVAVALRNNDYIQNELRANIRLTDEQNSKLDDLRAERVQLEADQAKLLEQLSQAASGLTEIEGLSSGGEKGEIAEA